MNPLVGDVLETILADKRREIETLHTTHDLATLRQTLKPSTRNFVGRLQAAKAAHKPILIAEFKRRSPSAGLLNTDADLESQLLGYEALGAQAVSILTDSTHFGGSYADLAQAANVFTQADSPLLLQKDFILDPIQLYIGRAAGADAALLIATILTRPQLITLRAEATLLGMGILLETHDAADLEKIRGLDFQIIGVNNRDLRSFRVSLNRSNVLAKQLPPAVVKIAESGIRSALDYRIVQQETDGILVGSSLMQGQGSFSMTQARSYFFKACGIRKSEDIAPAARIADLIGLNFSPHSKRRITPEILSRIEIPDNAVAVFYGNTTEEIEMRLAQYSFRYVQLYAEDADPAFVQRLTQKVLLALKPNELHLAEAYGPYIDAFILDGDTPGSGEIWEAPTSFPYPFLLAGGMNLHTLTRAAGYPNCIGIDSASGIEEEGEVSLEKIKELAEKLVELG